MDTVSVRMDLPKDILLAANISEANAQTDIMKHLALYMFKERILSFGKATELSGISKLSFMEFAGSKGVAFNYDTDDYYEDLNTIKGLRL
jgi:predicted HTH domain antitoxin